MKNQTYEGLSQLKNSFDRKTMLKICRGAIYSAIVAFVCYLLQFLSQQDFGVYTPLIMAMIAVILNAVKEFKKGI